MIRLLLASTGKGLHTVVAVVLQCLIKSGGIPSLPVTLPDAKLSMALLSSSTIGSESDSSKVGRQAMTSGAAGDTVFSTE